MGSITAIIRVGKRTVIKTICNLSFMSSQHGPHHARPAAAGKFSVAVVLQRSNSWSCEPNHVSLLQRAEHNDGVLADLQELMLHQQNIEVIELIGHACRHLKILYLTNNLISSLRGLEHLKASHDNAFSSGRRQVACKADLVHVHRSWCI